MDAEYTASLYVSEGYSAGFLIYLFFGLFYRFMDSEEVFSIYRLLFMFFLFRFYVFFKGHALYGDGSYGSLAYLYAFISRVLSYFGVV